MLCNKTDRFQHILGTLFAEGEVKRERAGMKIPALSLLDISAVKLDVCNKKYLHA